jgi:hypothetical protein
MIMAADIQLVGYYGPAPGTKTVVATVGSSVGQRYNTAIPTQRDPGLSKPNNVPATGVTNRSCWQYVGMEVLTSGSFSQITNLRWGTPGNIVSTWGLGSGMVQVALKDGATDPGCPLASYAQGAGVDGQYGYDIKDLSNGHPYYREETIACADADSYTSSSPLVFDTTVYTTQVSAQVSKLVTTQLVIEDDTEFGNKADLNCFIMWSEI